MTFTITRLVNNRAQVKGTDIVGVSGSTVVDTTQWDDINANSAFSQAVETFDAAVKEFYAPLEAAQEKLDQLRNKPVDSTGYVVLSEAVEGQVAQAERIIKLTKDSVILRLIEQGAQSRLVWVGDDLEVLAETPAASTPSVSGVNDNS
jgi:hypothetical protein